MYIIENITDRKNNVKEDFIKDLKELHPKLEGEILYKEYLSIGNFLCLLWNDNSNKMLRTSIIMNISYDNDIIIVETKNSIYYLKEL